MQKTKAKTLAGIKRWLAQRNESDRLALVDWNVATAVHVDSEGNLTSWEYRRDVGVTNASDHVLARTVERIQRYMRAHFGIARKYRIATVAA